VLSVLLTDHDSQLDELLGTSIAAFDIPDAVYSRAVARYENAASWLSDRWPGGGSGGLIYPQGSIRLGTMVSPINPKDEYDIDLVCRRDIAKESTSQEALKTDVGDGLAAYVTSRPEGLPSRREGKRCWTLDYPRDPFHMDVLPALPDLDGVPNAILLTDKELRAWQRSNPIDYAAWFSRKQEYELTRLREALAKRMDVEHAPPSQMKTTLQRTVQALKRHRDIYFARSSEDGPASIIITTLAAMAYNGNGTLYELLVDVTAQMPLLVERRNGVYWISNPVQDKENFADRWRGRPERAERFFRWIEQAHSDFAGLGAERGVDQVLEKMARSFGEEPAKRAGDALGTRLADAREAGRLGIGAAGLLGRPRRRPIPPHTFHGDAPTRSRS